MPDQVVVVPLSEVRAALEQASRLRTLTTSLAPEPAVVRAIKAAADDICSRLEAIERRA